MRTDHGRCQRCAGVAATAPDAGASDVYTRRPWRRRRLDYLAEHPFCTLCPAAATVPDHHPVSRRALVAAGVADPDDDQHLRPLCARCHNRSTARLQPGGFNADSRG